MEVIDENSTHSLYCLQIIIDISFVARAIFAGKAVRNYFSMCVLVACNCKENKCKKGIDRIIGAGVVVCA